MIKTDVKTTYIDITQLPVAPDEDEIRLHLAADMSRFLEELTASAFGIDVQELKLNPNLTTERINQFLFKGYALEYALGSLCTPSRNPITAFGNL